MPQDLMSVIRGTADLVEGLSVGLLGAKKEKYAIVWEKEIFAPLQTLRGASVGVCCTPENHRQAEGDF